MVSALGFGAQPGEIIRFLIATHGFVAFMRTREAELRAAKTHSRKADIFDGQCKIDPSTIERMIDDGLLTFTGCESITIAGILEYFEPTDKAKAEFPLNAGG